MHLACSAAAGRILRLHAPESVFAIAPWACRHYPGHSTRFNSRLGPSKIPFGLKASNPSHAAPAKVEFPSTGGELRLPDAEIESRLATAARKKGKWSAIRLHDRYKNLGYVTSQATFRAVLHERFDVASLKFYESAFSLKADATVWAKMVHNATTKATPVVMVGLYNSALNSGIRPTAALLHPVLRALCARGLRPPTEDQIDYALRLYQQFLTYTRVQPSADSGDATPSGPQEQQSGTKYAKANSEVPDLPIFNTLLRALASSPNIKKYYPIALTLLEDLHSRDIAIDNMTSTSLIVLLIRCSPTHDEAFQVYRSFSREMKGKYTLDGEGYAAVLNAFCTVGANSTRIPPAHLFFQIIKDMRATGYATSPKIYTIILQRLAFLANRINTSAPPAEREPELILLAQQIKRVEEALRLDASLTPDAALWNQLMDTYQRARCFKDACAIWELLYLSYQNDNISVSIILDACGYAKARATAFKIWDNLITSRFPLNLNNWKSWLECLCRMGEFEHAMKMLCLEMGKRVPHVTPDVDCVKILLSFAISTTREEEVLDRVRRYLPDLWKIWQKKSSSN